MPADRDRRMYRRTGSMTALKDWVGELRSLHAAGSGVADRLPTE
jgi:hypothetical protein